MTNPKTIRTSNDPNGRWTIHQGDVQQILPTLSSSLYDAVLSDPPYGFGFMNHAWDSQVPPTSVWQSLLNVCKPGAPILAFGGTKTFHRLTCNIEDAGWEIPPESAKRIILEWNRRLSDTRAPTRSDESAKQLSVGLFRGRLRDELATF